MDVKSNMSNKKAQTISLLEKKISLKIKFQGTFLFLTTLKRSSLCSPLFKKMKKRELFGNRSVHEMHYIWEIKNETKSFTHFH